MALLQVLGMEVKYSSRAARLAEIGEIGPTLEVDDLAPGETEELLLALLVAVSTIDQIRGLLVPVACNGCRG